MRIKLAIVACLLLAVPCLLPATNAPLTGDTFVAYGATTTNYGRATFLEASSNGRALLMFDLSTLPAGTTAATVAKATLTLYVEGPSTLTGNYKPGGSFNVFRVGGSWNEGTATWNYQPGLQDNVASGVPFPAGTGNVFWAVDVTKAVQEWVS